jgi:cytochrome d ubiquinol oxidase subunit II
LIAAALPAAYVLLGACWLVMKTDNTLQTQAIVWAKQAWPPVVLGMGLISIATPLVSDTVRARWFSLPEFIVLLPIPLLTLVTLVAARLWLSSRNVRYQRCTWPFFAVMGVFAMGGIGLGYSIFPYVVMDKLTIWQAASARESLAVILVGVAITVPAILGYTVFSYRVFRGKAAALSYG